jgi:hypothetical protein
LLGPPKFTQNWNFWFENKPSGNPGAWVAYVAVSSPPAAEESGAYGSWVRIPLGYRVVALKRWFSDKNIWRRASFRNSLGKLIQKNGKS